MRVLGIHVEAHNVPNSHEGERGIMLASNHVSWLDIQLLDSLFPARYIAKSEIRDWPGAGWIAERAGTLFVQRQKRSDTGRINNEIAEVLKTGDAVGLFPEGTTSEGDVLRRFHGSLMEPAITSEAFVVPVAVRYKRADDSLCREVAFVGELSFAQSVSLVIRQRRITAHVYFLPPIATVGKHRRDVSEAAYNAIANQLGLSTEGTPPKSLADLLAEQR